MKLYTYALLLTCCSSMMSMTPDKQLVSLDHGKLDPLKSKIMTQIDKFSETSGGANFTTGERVLNVINACTDKESKSINWVQSIKGLKKLEKSQGLSKPISLSIAALSALNLVWLGYPLINKMLGAEQLCFLEEMDGMIAPLTIANYGAFIVSLAMSCLTCGSPSKRLTKQLHDYIKGQESSGNKVTVEGLKPIVAQFTRKSTSLYGKFSEAAQFAELPDGSIDVAQFKKVFPRSSGLDSEGLRYLLAFSFLANVIPSVLCGPGYQQDDNRLLQVMLIAPAGLIALINALAGVGEYPGTSKQVSTDIRSVINLIQDHLDEQRASDDMV